MFGSRLKDARKNKKLTQQNMADMLLISLNGYQKYEQGERFPNPDLLVQIADTLDVSLDYLLGRDEFMKVHGVSIDEFL